MQEIEQGGRLSNPDPQFKFWENSFDNLKFLYDHLNLNEVIAKEKSIGPQQLSTKLGAYLTRSVVMVRVLFEVGDDSDQAGHRLS